MIYIFIDPPYPTVVAATTDYETACKISSEHRGWIMNKVEDALSLPWEQYAELTGTVIKKR